jgi:hypothetical protein
LSAAPSGAADFFLVRCPAVSAVLALGARFYADCGLLGPCQWSKNGQTRGVDQHHKLLAFIFQLKRLIGFFRSHSFYNDNRTPKKRSGRHATRLRRDAVTARLSCNFNFLTIPVFGTHKERPTGYGDAMIIWTRISCCCD